MSQLNRVQDFLNPKLPEIISIGEVERSPGSIQNHGQTSPNRNIEMRSFQSMTTGGSTTFDRRVFEKLLSAHYTMNEILSNCHMSNDSFEDDQKISFVFNLENEVHQYLMDLRPKSTNLLHSLQSMESLITYIAILVQMMFKKKENTSRINHLVRLNADGFLKAGENHHVSNYTVAKQVMLPMFIDLPNDAGSELWVVLALIGNRNDATGTSTVDFHAYDLNVNQKDDHVFDHIKATIMKYVTEYKESIFGSRDVFYNGNMIIHDSTNIPDVASHHCKYLVWQMHPDTKVYGVHLSLLMILLEYLGHYGDSSDPTRKKCARLIMFIKHQIKEQHDQTSILNISVVYLICKIVMSGLSIGAIEIGEVSGSDQFDETYDGFNGDALEILTKYVLKCACSEY